jgi:hypothetical protein
VHFRYVAYFSFLLLTHVATVRVEAEESSTLCALLTPSPFDHLTSHMVRGLSVDIFSEIPYVYLPGHYHVNRLPKKQINMEKLRV